MTGIKPHQLSDRQRAVKATEMRIEGKSWQVIADELNYYDRSTACKAVRNLNNRVEMETVEEFRDVQSARYESLYERAVKEIDEATAKGQLVGKSQLLTAARGILDSQTKLLGLAVTQRVELGGEVKVGNKDLDRAIEGFLEMLGGAGNPQVAPEEAQDLVEDDTEVCLADRCVLMAGHRGDHSDGTEVWA